MIYLYALITWFILVILAIINGSIRNFIYQPYTGELPAHQISTIIFCLLILAAAYVFLSLLKKTLTKTQLILIGLFWLVLTILFEFIFQHYVMAKSWQILLADYNFLQGRIWLLVLIITFLAPYLSSKFISKYK